MHLRLKVHFLITTQMINFNNHLCCALLQHVPGVFYRNESSECGKLSSGLFPLAMIVQWIV